jgi:centromeric protein E
MATALPRPPRPSQGPPTVALPALPVTKTRKSAGGIPTPNAKPNPNTPKSGLRAPSTTFLPPSSPPPTAALPQPQARSVTGISNAGKSLRKTVSINSFPQPPRSDARVASMPPSPLSTGVSTPGKKSKASITSMYQYNSTPSLLNGLGEGKSVARNAGVRTSDGVISISSPPQSRSSSAQDSYSTSATQYDDVGEGTSQKRDTIADLSGSKAAPKGDGKGNVLVSVRVRPDAAGSDHNKPEGEWMVDGRKSLIAYHGKEGGDYIYGRASESKHVCWWLD